MKVYKLTHKNGMTRPTCFNATQWGWNVTNKTNGGPKFPGEGWLHFFYNPLIAVMIDPAISGYNLDNAILWEADARGTVTSLYDQYGGCTELTTINPVEIPKVTNDEHVAFAIMCTLNLYNNKAFNDWAVNWLNGLDRSARSAIEVENNHRVIGTSREDDCLQHLYDKNGHALYAAKAAAFIADSGGRYGVNAAAWSARYAAGCDYSKVTEQWEEWRRNERQRIGR